MSVTFDGIQKLIICSFGTVSLNVQTVYSQWKEWVQSGQGLKFLPAFEAIGGQPLPGGLYAGQTYFLINGWKIQPQAANHRLTIVGNLYTSDGSPITVSVPGFTIEVNLNTSAQAQAIAVSGNTISIADIWNYGNRTLTANPGITVNQVDSILADNFTAILTAISLLPNTATIADLKLLVEEIHQVHGLKANTPVTVTHQQRVAGSIVQSIIANPPQPQGTVTITRQ